MDNKPDENPEALKAEEVTEIPESLTRNAVIRLTKISGNGQSHAFKVGDFISGQLLVHPIKVGNNIMIINTAKPRLEAVGPTISSVEKIIKLSDGTYVIHTANSSYSFDPKENETLLSGGTVDDTAHQIVGKIVRILPPPSGGKF